MTASDWRLLKAPFYQLIVEGATKKLDLWHHPLMPDGLVQWQQVRVGGQQGYSAFLPSYLGGMGTKTVFQVFERRYQKRRAPFSDHITIIFMAGPSNTYLL